MGRIFSERRKYELWLKIELAVAEAWVKEGTIPKSDFDEMRKKARFSVQRIHELEESLEHEVIAFTTCVAEHIGSLSRYFHLGLTSSDIMDTALSLQMSEAFELILAGLDDLLVTVRKLAIKHKNTLMIGRTHGMHSEPITFGLKALLWYTELKRSRERIVFASEQVKVGKISGAVGNYAHVPPSVEEYALKKLGLSPAPISSQILQRDRHAFVLCTLAVLAGSLEKIAVEIRNLQRSEVGELSEPFKSTQKGSSAMPHKKNPVLCERMSGLARLMRAYAGAALENQPTWNERDISHSSCERVAIADSFILADYMLSKMNYILSGLAVNEERMRSNLKLSRGLIYSQKILLALTEKGLSRERAYKIVQSASFEAAEKGIHLRRVLRQNKEVLKLLSLKELDALFDPKSYLIYIDEIYKRALD